MYPDYTYKYLSFYTLNNHFITVQNEVEEEGVISGATASHPYKLSFQPYHPPL